MLNNRPFFIVGEVKQHGGYSCAWFRWLRWSAAFTDRSRESEILISRDCDPSGETQPAGPEHDLPSGDVEVRQRLF